MLREKLVWTAILSCAIIAAAMLADFVITIAILRDYAAYTPHITLAIATVVTFPAVYVFVSGRIELRYMRDQLAVARDDAVEASRSKSEFLANMSHELRTPLNAILGFSEMLASDLFVDKRAEYADLIHSSGAHLLGLVNDLLDLSRIEANKLELREEDFDPAALVDECATFVAPHAEQGHLTIATNLAAGLPRLHADRRALKQILLNLLTNAIKFTEPGGTIEVIARPEVGGGFLIGVKDNGLGIAEEEQTRMFERFGQSRHDITHALKGTGLGLPIVKGLAEAHGGHVAMASALGEGTCVTVWLPPARVLPTLTSKAA